MIQHLHGFETATKTGRFVLKANVLTVIDFECDALVWPLLMCAKKIHSAKSAVTETALNSTPGSVRDVLDITKPRLPSTHLLNTGVEGLVVPKFWIVTLSVIEPTNNRPKALTSGLVTAPSPEFALCVVVAGLLLERIEVGASLMDDLLELGRV